jgi:aryl-alcohol dehydrogenase-like predicted oxidoreductase
MTAQGFSSLTAQTGVKLSALGFGAFKIGRNQGIKYSTPYDLPDLPAVDRLLNSVLDLGCTLIDTAPAYGLSEERIGLTISHRRSEFVLCTKVGETFEQGNSTFDFSAAGVTASIERSLQRLKTDVLDIVLIHSSGDDRRIMEQTDVVPVLRQFCDRGIIRAIGLSGKTVEGATLALTWADVIMVEYHLQDVSHRDVMAEAAKRDVGVFVKKGLASGKLDPAQSVQFVLSNADVTSLIVGGLNRDHFADNWRTALKTRDQRRETGN